MSAAAENSSESPRTIKSGGFCWQNKAVLERIRQQIEDYSTALCVYLALTVVASDNGSENAFTTTHAWLRDLSGISTRTIKRRLAELQRIGVIKVFTPTIGAPCTYQLLTLGHHGPTLGHHGSGGRPRTLPLRGLLEEEIEERKKKNGTYHPDSRTVLHLLNEAAGKHFRELDCNLSLISARLREPEVTLEGVKLMVQRQCARWLDTPQAEYLRPETLFGKSKFDSYYANRGLPVIHENNARTHKPSASDVRNKFIVGSETSAATAAAVVARQSAERAKKAAADALATKVAGSRCSSS